MCPVNNLVSIADMTIEAVVSRWPQTAEVFVQRNMACVGCPVSHLYTITEAAEVYKLTVADFVEELEAVIAGEPIQDQN